MTFPTALTEDTGQLGVLDLNADPDEFLPHAIALMNRLRKVPSRNVIMEELHVGVPRANRIRKQLISRHPDVPVSGGAPATAPMPATYQQVALDGHPANRAGVRQRLRGTAVHRSIALLVPLLLVNTAAVYGNQGWAYDHLTSVRVIAILFATTLESIGIYLAAEAHAALMAGDASARLRMGSYLVALLVGCLNYAHFSTAGYRPNPLALTFGMLSSISPWLWSIRSRSLNRERLRELGQVDPRAVRFSLLRWVLYPVRTSAAFRLAVWEGVVQPAEAIANADAVRAHRELVRADRKHAAAAAKKHTADNAAVFIEPAIEPA